MNTCGNGIEKLGNPPATDGWEQKAMDELNAALRNLRQAEYESESKSHALAEVTHELSSPLNVISMNLGILLRTPGITDEQRELITDSQFHLRVASRLVGDLHDLSRLQHRKLSLDLQPVDLHGLIRKAAEGAARELNGSRLIISIDLAAGRHTVQGDPDRLLQIIWNLLRNALKFTPDGGTILIRTFNELAPELGAELFLAVQVRDSGIGIDNRDLENIFIPFHQARSKAPPATSGLGLGLSLSRHLAELHGGTLTAQSDGNGCGSTFTLEIPTDVSSH